MTNKDEPAFPAEWTEVDEKGQTRMLFSQGITKREYFAAMALQGLQYQVAKNRDEYQSRITQTIIWTPKVASKFALEQADALIAELNKETKNG